MTAWGRPQEQDRGAAPAIPAAEPPPSGPGGLTAPLTAYRRARRLPWNLLRAGLGLLLIAIVTLIMAVRLTPPSSPVTVPGDGSTRGFTLLKNTPYGFYSDDYSLTCEVVDPAGESLALSSTVKSSAHSPLQVLGFRSTQAGLYSVSCSGTGEIIFDTATVSPESRRSFHLALAAGATGIVAVLLIIVASPWLLVLRLRRPRPAPSAPVSDPAPGAPRPPDAPGPTGAAPSAEPGAAPVAPPTPGAYGLAPQQVVYRPMPPPRGPDGS